MANEKDKTKKKEAPKKEEAAEYRAEVNYPVNQSNPRMEILRNNVFAGPKFDMKDINDEKTRQMAREYAAEMQREGRGMKKGGVVKSSASKRADGCAQRGKTRGKMV